jgi:hypothetical protein
MSGPLYRRTKEEVDREIADMKSFGKELRRSKKRTKAFLIKCGFITEEGKLTKQYGG